MDYHSAQVIVFLLIFVVGILNVKDILVVLIDFKTRLWQEVETGRFFLL